MYDAFEAVENACAENIRGNMEIPKRIQMANITNSSSTFFMPARLSYMGIVGLKIVSRVPNNAKVCLPINVGMIIIFDVLTGLPLLVLEASYITDIRTGALTGVACKHLARSNSEILAIIGTGSQARTQVLAIVKVLNIVEIRVFSRKPTRINHFIQAMKNSLMDINFVPCNSSKEAVRGADVVVCATSASNPVLFRDWVDLGTFVCAIGAHTPYDREVDSETVRDASIIVADCRKSVLTFGGDVVIPINEGLIDEKQVIDLGELILGRKRYIQSESKIAFFKSVGFAGVDIYIAKKLLEMAEKMNKGVDIHFLPN